MPMIYWKIIRWNAFHNIHVREESSEKCVCNRSTEFFQLKNTTKGWKTIFIKTLCHLEKKKGEQI